MHPRITKSRLQRNFKNQKQGFWDSLISLFSRERASSDWTYDDDDGRGSLKKMSKIGNWPASERMDFPLMIWSLPQELQVCSDRDDIWQWWGSHGGIDLFIFPPTGHTLKLNRTGRGLQFTSHTHRLNLWSGLARIGDEKRLKAAPRMIWHCCMDVSKDFFQSMLRKVRNLRAANVSRIQRRGGNQLWLRGRTLLYLGAYSLAVLHYKIILWQCYEILFSLFFFSFA